MCVRVCAQIFSVDGQRLQFCLVRFEAEDRHTDRAESQRRESKLCHRQVYDRAREGEQAVGEIRLCERGAYFTTATQRFRYCFVIDANERIAV